MDASRSINKYNQLTSGIWIREAGPAHRPECPAAPGHPVRPISDIHPKPVTNHFCTKSSERLTDGHAKNEYRFVVYKIDIDLGCNLQFADFKGILAANAKQKLAITWAVPKLFDLESGRDVDLPEPRSIREGHSHDPEIVIAERILDDAAYGERGIQMSRIFNAEGGLTVAALLTGYADEKRSPVSVKLMYLLVRRCILMYSVFAKCRRYGCNSEQGERRENE